MGIDLVTNTEEKKYSRMTWVFCLGDLRGHGTPGRRKGAGRRHAHLSSYGVAGTWGTSERMCHTTSHYTVSHILFPNSPQWLPNMIQGLQLAWQDLPGAPDTLPASGAPHRERSMSSNGHIRAWPRDFLLYLLPSALLLNNQIAAISLNGNTSYFLCRKSAPSLHLSPVRHPVSRTLIFCRLPTPQVFHGRIPSLTAPTLSATAGPLRPAQITLVSSVL